jgi:hypothetical protein
MSKTIKRYWRRETLAFTLLGCAAIAVALIFFSTPPTVSAKNNVSTPTINCNGSTQSSINILVTAGATGAPAGFSLQWMTAADYAANGNQWFDSDDTRLCKASFSGNANLSRYNLGPGESVSVNVGEFLFDNGASTNCPDGLTCGTDYVFRAFAHATNSLNRSDFTENLICATLECDQDLSCTYTQGFWKTHGPAGPSENAWPPSVLSGGMTLGSVNYTAAQLQSIFNAPAAGNGLIVLAHQLIAAKLNIANGASVPPAVATAIANADALIGSLVIPPVGSGFLSPAATSTLTSTLTDYNEGATGPGHCV